jgi:hypothetical protein
VLAAQAKAAAEEKAKAEAEAKAAAQEAAEAKAAALEAAAEKAAAEKAAAEAKVVISSWILGNAWACAVRAHCVSGKWTHTYFVRAASFISIKGSSYREYQTLSVRVQ